MAKDIPIIENCKLVYKLQPEDRWALFNNCIVIANPEHKPKIIRPDGTIEELKLCE